MTGLPLTDIRVVAPAVGGGFGVKDHIECDEMLVVLATLRLGRTVTWIEDRWESLVTTPQARDEHYDVRVAFDVRDAWVGDRTSASIQIRTLLGAKYLEAARHRFDDRRLARLASTRARASPLIR